MGQSQAGSICQGQSEEIKINLDQLQIVNDIVVTILIVFQMIIAIASTIYIFSRRTCKEIPTFVSL